VATQHGDGGGGCDRGPADRRCWWRRRPPPRTIALNTAWLLVSTTPSDRTCYKTRSPAVARVDRPYNPYPNATVRLPVAKRKRFRRVTSDYSPIDAMVRLLCRTLHSSLGYDKVIRRTCLIGCGSNFALKIAAKPLHIQTWLLWKSYGNSSSHIQRYFRRFLTTYRLSTVHALQTTDKQIDVSTVGRKLGKKFLL